MSYVLYDINGYVADVASVCGYDDLYQFVKKQAGVPYLKTFMDNGETEQQTAVISDIAFILPKCTDLTIKPTLSALSDSLKKAQGIAIVSE